MNCLLIDQGNSRIKLAWRGDAGVGEVLAGSDPAALLDRLDRAPGSVWLASVAGQHAREALTGELQARFACLPKQASVRQHQAYLPTRYAPGQLGVDRWLGLLAARRLCTGPLVVVDAGTAITIDVLTGEGEHLGGYILPGFQLMHRVLLDATAIDETPPLARQQHPPRDTVSAIDRAGPAAVAALVARLRSEHAEKAGDMAGLVLGGGAAGELAGLLDPPLNLTEQLVLRGLAILSRLEEERCAG